MVYEKRQIVYGADYATIVMFNAVGMAMKRCDNGKNQY
jgi:hypothetical protein